MFLAGGIKGVFVPQFAKHFENVTGIRIDNLSPEAEILLYQGTNKSVVALQNGNATLRIDIPQGENEDICVSITNQKNAGVATFMSSAGATVTSIGQWIEDGKVNGFSSQGDVVKNKSVSSEEGIKRYALARSLLNSLEWSFS